MIHLIAPTAALVASLLSYASGVSGLPIPPAPLPAIHLVSHAPNGNALGLDKPEAGSTDTTTGDIYLYPGWNAENGSDRCLLAHELTHWLQIKGGSFFRMSIEAAERQAYQVTLACSEALGRPRAEIEWARSMVRQPHIASP